MGPGEHRDRVELHGSEATEQVAGPPRIRGPRSDWAARAILRASRALREIADPGTGVFPAPASGKIRTYDGTGGGASGWTVAQRLVQRYLP